MKLSESKKFDLNPFIENALIKIEEKKVTRKRFVKGSKGIEHTELITSNGEILGHSAFLQFVEVDEDKFAKIYLSQFGAFWDLSKNAIRVFSYLLSSLLPKKDIVYINMPEALKHTKYKHKQSVFNGLSSLCENGIIARSQVPYMYYINPLVFFNGDRVTFAKTYVRKRTKKIKQEADKRQMSLPFSEDFD